MGMITREEKDVLQAKLDALIANRPVMSKRIAEARELGDLKENADYHAAKEDQGKEEAEIRRLTELLANSQVVSEQHKSVGVVFVGATVKVVEVKVGDGDAVEEVGDVEVFRLVGESTGGGSAGGDVVEATVSSPFGEALLKARVGEGVAVRGPRGIKRFQVKEIL
jgi:transcription elongation factor GreA